MMACMTRFIRKFFGFEPTLDQKVQAGIDFTIRNYGQTLKDLARFDKGEALSDSHHDREERVAC